MRMFRGRSKGPFGKEQIKMSCGTFVGSIPYFFIIVSIREQREKLIITLHRMYLVSIDIQNATKDMSTGTSAYA